LCANFKERLIPGISRRNNILVSIIRTGNPFVTTGAYRRDDQLKDESARKLPRLRERVHSEAFFSEVGIFEKTIYWNERDPLFPVLLENFPGHPAFPELHNETGNLLFI
jgi:hypothetical protein